MTTTMDDYRVELDYYSGPLDLLLHLVRKHEIDLYDIPIAQLTEQYLTHLEHVQRIDINLAGEFLVMAATLLEIKSQMLAPQAQTEDGSDGQSGDGVTGLAPSDPRYELVQQLLAYKRYKDAAVQLEARLESWRDRLARQPAKTPSDKGAADGKDSDDDAQAADALDLELDDVTLLDLCQAFGRILESIGQGPARHEVVYDDTPIALHAEDIIDRLQRDAVDGSMTLQEMFVGRATRSEMIGLFLATLELVRQKRLRVVQDKACGQIRLQLTPAGEQLGAGDDQPTDWRDPQTGKVQYDWPSPEVKERFEQRAARRFARLQQGQYTSDDQDDVIDLDEPASPAPEASQSPNAAESTVDLETPEPHEAQEPPQPQ